MRLSKKVAPKTPGVYFFRDKSGRILYIGKAGNLANRLKSYFSSKTKDPRIEKMLDIAAKLDWQETGSEIEALILESQLIKKHRPPFNVMLRDDKEYFYVAITLAGQAKELFPKIFVVHKKDPKNKVKIANLIGPFTDGGALRTTLKLLRRIFPYCTCKQPHNNYCLNYHIGNCPGFCCLKKETTKDQVESYKKNIKSIKNILEGKRLSLAKKLEKEMTALAKKEEFIKAIALRNKLAELRWIFENAKVLKELGDRQRPLRDLQKSLDLPLLPSRIEGYDVSNIQGRFATGAMVVFVNGQPDKNEYRKFKILVSGSPDDTAMLKEVLRRRLGHGEWQYPELILIDGGRGQLNAAVSVIEELKIEIPVIALTKDERHRGHHVFSSSQKLHISLTRLSPAVRNLILQIDAEAHRFAISYYRKLHRKF